MASLTSDDRSLEPAERDGEQPGQARLDAAAERDAIAQVRDLAAT